MTQERTGGGGVRKVREGVKKMMGPWGESQSRLQPEIVGMGSKTHD